MDRLFYFQPKVLDKGFKLKNLINMKFKESEMLPGELRRKN